MGGSEMIQFIIIKTKDRVFITDNSDEITCRTYSISSYLFDGLRAKETFKKGWYELPAIPVRVEQKTPDMHVNYHYELKERYQESEMIPKVLNIPSISDSKYSEISGMYTRNYDVIPGEWQPVDFEIEVLSEEEDFYIKKPKYPYTSDLMVQLTTPDVLRTGRPCSISSSDLYAIVRAYIKQNIDGHYARITSDYDFCFTVKKLIKLHEPQVYTTDLNYDNNRRKPNIVKRFNNSKEITIFESCPKGYDKYPIQAGITGKNYKDLEEKIDVYLKELITKINEPLIECPSCKGYGVIIEK